MVSSFKQNRKHKTVNKLHINNTELTRTNEICNAFNNYFSTVGQELVINLTSDNSFSNQNHDFTKYYGKPMKKNSMYCEPVTKDALFKLINNLPNGKSPGFDNIGPKLL